MKRRTEALMVTFMLTPATLLLFCLLTTDF